MDARPGADVFGQWDTASQWDDVLAFRVRKYRLIDEVERLDDRAPVLLGPVADELELTSPGLVSQDVFGIGSVKTSIMYMKGLVALQEAQRRIVVLEAAVDALTP